MEHEITTYFEENEEDAVKGFTIIDHAGDEYHIAEKWVKPDADNKWLQYHIPAEQLEARIAQGKCQPKAQLTDEQFAAVCEAIDHDEVTPEKITA